MSIGEGITLAGMKDSMGIPATHTTVSNTGLMMTTLLSVINFLVFSTTKSKRIIQ